MTTDFGLFADRITGRRHASERKRGEVVITAQDEGPRAYFYSLPPGTGARAFKAWVRTTWATNDGRCVRITGRWPAYTVSLES